MYKVKTLIILILLSGCTSLQKTQDFSGLETYQKRAAHIFQIAKTCWDEEPSLLLMKYGTKVTQSIQPNQIVIEARWVSVGEVSGIHDNKQDPFIRIIVRPVTTGSIVEIHEKSHPYIGKSSYKNASTNWANGNYQCI